MLEGHRADRRRQWRRVGGGADIRHFRQQFRHPAGGAGGALHLAPQLAHGGTRGRQQHRIEHEGRQIAAGDTPGDHIAPAHPQRKRDGAKTEHDHQQNYQRAHLHPRQRCFHRAFDAYREMLAGNRLVREGLHGAQPCQRFLGGGAEIGNTLLRGTRQLALTTAKQNHRPHHNRHHQQHDASQLRTGDQQHRQRAEHENGAAQILRHRRADQRLQHRDISGHPRQNIAGARGFEERRRQADNLLEQIAPDIAGRPLPKPGHQIKPHRRR